MNLAQNMYGLGLYGRKLKVQGLGRAVPVVTQTFVQYMTYYCRVHVYQ